VDFIIFLRSPKSHTNEKFYFFRHQFMKRILVTEVNWLGDSILTTPVFKALKESFPSSYVGVMTVERVADIFLANSYIDEVIIFDEKKTHRSFLSKMKFISFLKKKRFDTVFLIHRSFTRALICFLAGIKNRIGFRRFKNIFVVNRQISPSSKTMHRQDQYFYLFEKYGIEIKDRNPMVSVSDNSRNNIFPKIKDLKDNYSYIVGINPSANWKLKRWPEENFSFLSDRLVKELNCAVVLIGAKKEKQIVDAVIRHMSQTVYDFCGMTNLSELEVLIENFDVFISNDSGPAHLAAALGMNTLVLFGPTSSDITSPRGSAVKVISKDTDCRIPCYNLQCKDNKCMRAIDVDEVFIEVEKILKNAKKDNNKFSH